MKKRIFFVALVVFSFVASTMTMVGVASAYNIYYQGSWPIVVSSPGSYKLIANLNVPDANTTAIVVKADNVTIDLNGFAITGPEVCGGTPFACKPKGTGIGIDAWTYNKTRTVVKNGIIKGMGRFGVALNDDSVVSHLVISNIGVIGIVAEKRALITSNNVSSIGGDGIAANQNSLIKDNVVNDVLGATIDLVSGGTAISNAVNAGEGGIGLYCGLDSNCFSTNNVVVADFEPLSGGTWTTFGTLCSPVACP